MMSSSRDPTARLRAGLNPLLTNSLGGFGHNAGTPVSALSVAPHSAFTPAQTPMSAIQPYNPQEWIGSPQPGPVPDRMPHPPPAPPAQAYQEPQCKWFSLVCLDPRAESLTQNSITAPSTSVLASSQRTPREHDV